ncbi:MAG: hypothetical protein ABI431_01130, partial [Candidatus Tumulicola sp.]
WSVIVREIILKMEEVAAYGLMSAPIGAFRPGTVFFGVPPAGYLNRSAPEPLKFKSPPNRWRRSPLFAAGFIHEWPAAPLQVLEMRAKITRKLLPFRMLS